MWLGWVMVVVTTIDNTRVLAALRAEVNVQANIRKSKLRTGTKLQLNRMTKALLWLGASRLLL